MIFPKNHALSKATLKTFPLLFCLAIRPPWLAGTQTPRRGHVGAPRYQYASAGRNPHTTTFVKKLYQSISHYSAGRYP
jgi:hypothetical protein